MMLVIYGPTVTGKTDLAIQVAKKFNGELISADSRQVYRGLDITSGKVNFDKKVVKKPGYWIVDGIRIHGFDLIDPGTPFSVVDFLKFAHFSLEKITRLNKLPIVVGGTGFYIKSLIDGFQSKGIPPDSKLRKKLEKLSQEELFQKLLEIDPKRANTMNGSDRRNPRRLIRAIEITSTTPQNTIDHQVSTKDDLLICLTAPNSYLYSRADKWLDVRFKNGIVEEVKKSLDFGVNSSWLIDLGLEYRWVTRYLNKEINLEYAKERLRGDIHGFIRRQKTWISKFKSKELFDISQNSWKSKLEKTVKDWYTQESYGKQSPNKG